MEKETRCSKQQTLVSSSRSSPTTVNDIPDQLLKKLIFSRLDSHVAYIRAAAVCTRWRHILSVRGLWGEDWNRPDFSTTIGHYHVADPCLLPGQPRRRMVSFVPASPSIDARHFTLDFLPSCPGRRQHWKVVDGYGSLLLVANLRRHGVFPDDLIVCEPISRRYIRVQPVEDTKHRHCLGVFLDRWRYNNVPSICRFHLTCVLHEPSVGVADGVSTVTARVYQHQPPGWSRWKRGWTMPRGPRLESSGSVQLRGAESARFAGRSKGFIFWSIQDDGTVVAAQEGSCELSHFCMPEHVLWGGGSHHRSTSTFRFVDDGVDNNDNLVRVVSLVGDELRVFLKQEHNNDNGGGVDWVFVRSLNLREATRGLLGFKECFFSHTAKIVTAGKGYVVLTPAEETWLFSVELRTMQVDHGHIRNGLAAGEVYPYELRLLPRVRVCVFRCKRGRQRRCYNICRCK